MPEAGGLAPRCAHALSRQSCLAEIQPLKGYSCQPRYPRDLGATMVTKNSSTNGIFSAIRGEVCAIRCELKRGDYF